MIAPPPTGPFNAKSTSWSAFAAKSSMAIATRVEIKIGGRRPGWVEISAGLEVGDVIVRDGVGALRGEAPTIAVVET